MVPTYTNFLIAVSTASTVLLAAVMSPIAQRDTGAGLEYDASVIGTPAWDAFQTADVLYEIDAGADATNVFVLQCVDAGFKGHCLTFGSPVGKCLTYTSFSASIDKTYEDQVTSLSTNTGAKCHFYKNHACNAGGHDPGLQTAYDSDLSVDHAEYNNAISSWKC